MAKLLLSFFIMGLSFGLGPCLASCGPLLISYTAASSQNLIKSIAIYLLFSLGRLFIYVCVSLLIFLFGHAVISYKLGGFSRYVFLLGGLFIAIIGILLIFGKRHEHKLCQRLQGFFLNKDAKTAIIFGLIVGILPCAPLISVLSYIGLISRDWLHSVLLGLFFGLGTLVSPLFILVVFSGFIRKAVIEKNGFYRAFDIVFGLVIIFLGFQLMRRGF